MAVAYFDASAIVRRYVDEPGRPEVLKLARRYECLTSAVTMVEIRSALRRRVGDGSLDEADVDEVLRRCDQDRPLWGLVHVTSDVLDRAEALAASGLLRALDAIHVASAQLLLERAPVHSRLFITADRRQADAARSIGLRVSALA